MDNKYILSSKAPQITVLQDLILEINLQSTVVCCRFRVGREVLLRKCATALHDLSKF